MSKGLPALISALARAKEQKKTWSDTVTGIETQIADLLKQPGKDEGAVSQKTDTGYKVTATFKLSRTIDKDAYESVKHQIPAELNPVVNKPSLDIKKLKAIDTANPEMAKLCQKFIIIKPAKTAIAVKEV